MKRIAWALAAALTFGAGAAPSAAEDRHAGYYYPQPQSTETYYPRAQPLRNSDRERRLGFVTGVTQQQMQANYPISHVMFAKGVDAEKLIIVALQDGIFDSIFRARAYLAALTAVARTTPVFQELAVETSFTFFDLAVLLGFKQITISDGKGFSHQVTFE